MMNRPTATARTLTAAGCTLPKAAAHALANLQHIAEVVNHDDRAEAAAKVSPTTKPDDLAVMLRTLASTLAARDHLTNASVVLEEPLNRQFTEAIRANVDDLTRQLAEQWKAPAAIVSEAGRTFGPNTPANAILQAGPESAALHHQLGGALDALNRIRNARVTLADYASQSVEQDASWYIAGAADAEALEVANRAMTQAGNAFHNLAHAGFTLKLNTPSEAAAVRAEAEGVTRARRNAEHEHSVAANRAAHGMDFR